MVKTDQSFTFLFGRNEEGEEHLHQRRRQLPFNLSTGKGVLYDTWMESFSVSGPPDSDASSIPNPAEDCLDPASLLGSLHRQDHSVYSCTQKPSPQRFLEKPEDLDLEHPQPSLEQAFWDSHALLSVPGQTQSPQDRSVTGDLTAESMIESLEQIIGDIGNGGMEEFDIEETELRDWENTLVRKNNERQDTLNDLNQILANDVFSYVEEALMRETEGLLRGSEVHVPAPYTPTPTHNSQPWPSTSAEHMIPSQSCSLSQPEQPWHLPVNKNNNSIEQNQQRNPQNGRRLRESSPCRQQRPESPGGCTLTSCPCVAEGSDFTAPLHHPQVQPSPGSCGHGNRDGQIGTGAAAPVRANGSLPRPACSGGRLLEAHASPNAPFALSHPHTAACTDAGNVSSLYLNGSNGGLEMSPSDYLYRNASLPSSFYCWREEARVRRRSKNTTRAGHICVFLSHLIKTNLPVVNHRSPTSP